MGFKDISQFYCCPVHDCFHVSSMNSMYPKISTARGQACPLYKALITMLQYCYPVSK
uniref:Uncharacterized protein n=1 Tax=Anguilla anguilla TaxID=7936 RepID=A0A0E9U106_ANGAN